MRPEILGNHPAGKARLRLEVIDLMNGPGAESARPLFAHVSVTGGYLDMGQFAFVDNYDRFEICCPDG